MELNIRALGHKKMQKLFYRFEVMLLPSLRSKSQIGIE